MSERDSERIYWWITLCLVLLSPLIIYHLLLSDFPIRWNVMFLLALFFLGCFVVPMVSLVLAILVAAIFALLSGNVSKLKVWQKNQSAESIHTSDLTADESARAVCERLGELGFAFDHDVQAERVTFQKGLAFDDYPTFIDHAFQGSADFRSVSGGTQCHVQVSSQDTVIVDTGERQNLGLLSDYLSLKSNSFRPLKMLLSLAAGSSLAMLTAVTASISDVSTVFASAALLSFGVGTWFMILMSRATLLKKRVHFIGARLIYPCLYVGSIPFLALAIKLMLFFATA